MGLHARSARGTNASAGPSVINKKSGDAGYLRWFNNWSTSGIPSSEAGRAITVNPPMTRNAAVAASPMRSRFRLRSALSITTIAPQAYPRAITPTHGTIVYSTVMVGPPSPKRTSPPR